MSNHSPGWYPDALGRHAQRYYDGNAWTEHVADAAGNRSTDAVQAPPSAPPGATFAPPTPSAPSGTSSGWAPATTWSATAPSVPTSSSRASGPTQQASGTGAAGGSVTLTVGLIVVAVGALLTVLGLFALDYWSADGVGVNLGDIADAPEGAGISGVVSAYAGFGRFLGLLVIALAVVAVLRLPALKQYEAQLPLVAAGAAGLWGLWHLVGMFMSPDQFDAGPAIGALIGVLGYAGLAVGQFLRQPLGNVSR